MAGSRPWPVDPVPGSAADGNDIIEDDQFAKLSLVVETAGKVWG